MPPAKLALVAAACAVANAYVVPAAPARGASASLRAAAPCMDETLLEKTLAGELEQEGAENVFLTEVGWATYLDKNAKQSYNMNERVSKAYDGYFTADVFSNPADGARAARAGGLAALRPRTELLAAPAGRPLSPPRRPARRSARRLVRVDEEDPRRPALHKCRTRARAARRRAPACSQRARSCSGFPTISNDVDGARSYGAASEVKARTIKPKVKDFDPKKRITGIPGFNFFGAPSSKMD